MQTCEKHTETGIYLYQVFLGRSINKKYQVLANFRGYNKRQNGFKGNS